MSDTVTWPLRPLPAPENARTYCDGCRAPIVWAYTVAGPNGRGGKLMPLDPVEDLAGNVAITRPHAGGRLYARVLTKDERFDRPAEYAGMPHFAAGCHPSLPPIASVPIKKRGRRR